jgi:tripartite-type tricarboxylate transporter receptor subunit TctC
MTHDPIRRRVAHLCVATLAAPAIAASGSAHAQAQPGAVTRILVGFPPGQATDQVARLIAERLASVLGSPFIVENRPGQGGSLALAQLARAPADGSVLTLSALAGYSVNPYLYKAVQYDSVRDFAPIGLVADLPLALAVHPSVPANTLAELVAHARTNPEKLAHCSSGNGTLSHLLMEDLKQRAGIRILHVPYQGSPKAMVDLIAGNVQVGLDTVTVVQPHVKAGRLRMIAVSTLDRLSFFPDAPTIAEQGFPGLEASAWLAVLLPAQTPADKVERLSDAVVKVVGLPEIQKKFLAVGAIPPSPASRQTDHVPAALCHVEDAQQHQVEQVEGEGGLKGRRVGKRRVEDEAAQPAAGRHAGHREQHHHAQAPAGRWWAHRGSAGSAHSPARSR